MIKIDKFNNIEIIKGDTAIFDVELENHKIKENDEIYFSIKKSKYDSNHILKQKCEYKENNIAKFFLNESDTNIEPGIYFYDIKCKLEDGRIDTIILGKFTIIGDVTND